ncbi:MAG: hypothetical protein GY719_15590 [bacterium]|nr:hypothetical protein [bacterium]
MNNDLFGLSDSGTPGGQTRSTPISLDAIQELQLLLSPTDVRQGGFSGGGINAVTRSGSNDWKGSVFYFTRDDSLVGDGPDTLGEFGNFEDEEYGFRIGGPITRSPSAPTTSSSHSTTGSSRRVSGPTSSETSTPSKRVSPAGSSVRCRMRARMG